MIWDEQVEGRARNRTFFKGQFYRTEVSIVVGLLLKPLILFAELRLRSMIILVFFLPLA